MDWTAITLSVKLAALTTLILFLLVAALGSFVTALASSVPPASAGRLAQAAAASPGPLALGVLRGLASLGDQLPAPDAATSRRVG